MGEETEDLFGKLPEGFREKFTQEILSRTTPADVARLSLVSKSFYSSANSDVVWDKFIVIPPDHRERTIDHHTRDFPLQSSKEAFLFLCIHDFFENITDILRFWLDKWSGKMCLSIQKLAITQLETDYWKKSERRFPELGHVIWLEIYRKVPTSRLSPETTYEAYLVFDLSDYVVYGLHIPIEASVGIPGEKGTKEIIYLDPRMPKSKTNHHYPMESENGDLEVKLGEYFNKEGEDRDVEITLKEVKSGRPKCGVCLVGVEMRPKRLEMRPKRNI